MHPAIEKGAVAVVTGAASGIGLALARRLADEGLRVVMVDLPGDRLERAAADVPGATAIGLDVSDRAAVRALAETVTTRFGPPAVLVNNAGIQPGSSIFDTEGTWDRVLAVNLGGIVEGCRAFVPAMIATGRPGLVINTGSKQGITMPPGDPAYNVAKAGVKAYSEALQHALRTTPGCRVEARLLIPGFVFTGLTARGRTEKPAGAWTPEQVVDFLFAALERDDFYVLCPDGEVDRATDEKRIAWAAGDIVENRPPLSRWHPDWGAAFAAWLAE